MVTTDASDGEQRPSVLADLLPLVLPEGYQVDPRLAPAAQRAWSSARRKLYALVTDHPDQFPMYTTGGRWDFEGEAWTNWCEGFLGGQLWLAAAHSSGGYADWYRSAAERYCAQLLPRRTDDTVHDLGFLFWSSYYRWYAVTGEEALREVLITARRTMASRFRSAGGYLPSFRGPESLFIDIMMNVHLVYYAAAQTGDAELADVASRHCLTTRRYLVRGDGSAAHEGIFDPGTGEFLRQSTQQGYRADGSWARGQAWALHGFGTVYRFTGDRRFLQTACGCADFWLERTRDALVPPNDWSEPQPARPHESSAAAAAAAGLWQLAGLVQDHSRARAYADHAVSTLLELTGPDFLSPREDDRDGLLKHASYHEAKGLGVDESVMWGDYFLLDALDQVLA
ncbi:glycoside hydrolase family 88 protein [Ruania albidiflava]|uniref:glycoside hydrolase family 88 protein n=1 Tax=Ruania albidiflava TaxID=366586 RepID=UPI0003B74DE6|nr:glycoside hydrolase family 88 protein [Ruania albidiflava]